MYLSKFVDTETLTFLKVRSSGSADVHTQAHDDNDYSECV